MSKILLLFFLFLNIQVSAAISQQNKENSTEIKLPAVQLPSSKPLVKTIQQRHSWRRFKNIPLKEDQISLILWAATGKRIDALTAATRTIPSAGATYPLEVFLLVGRQGVSGLNPGFYQYIVDNHSLISVSNEDLRQELANSCLGQDFIKEAPVSLIIAVVYNRTTSRYQERGVRYVHIEVGHSCQNIYLIVQDLGLATVEVGAFDDQRLKNLLKLRKEIEPLIIMPIGYPD